jgi:diguanylate cyclase (GGDEF)-like protein
MACKVKVCAIGADIPQVIGEDQATTGQGPPLPEEPQMPRGLKPHRRTVAVAVVLGLLGLSAFAVIKRGADREGAQQRARVADQTVGSLRATLATTRSDVRGIVGVFSTARTVDDFAQFAQPALSNHVLSALAWAPQVTAAMRSSFENEHGFVIADVAGSAVHRAADRGVYYPLTFVQPSGANLRAIGVDAGQQPGAAAALAAAVESGQGRLSAPIDVLQGGRGLLLVEPSFRRGAPIGRPDERAVALTGFAVGTVRPDELVREALQGTSGIRVAIRDGSLPVYGRALAGGLVRSLEIGGRTWRIQVASDAGASAVLLPWVVLLAGLVVTALVALMVEQNARRLTWAEELVARRTVELREALAMLGEANSALDAARAEAERKSQVDALTDAYNRGHLIELLKVELNRAERGDTTPAVMLVDVDDFKLLNDEFGPTAGDIVLVEIAHRLRAMLRSYDSLGRFGNKQFAVLAPNVPDDEALFRVADAIRQVVCTGPVLVEGRELWPTVSVGAARAGATFDVFPILEHADQALAAARGNGRNRTCVHGASENARPCRGEPDAVRIAQALAKSAADREGMPEHHNRQVAELAAAVANSLGMPEEFVHRVRLAGWLHDVGKVAIPEAILSKPDRLDPAEWEIMRTHATVGEEIVARIADLAEAAPAVRHHHEHYDGTGYPDALAGAAIPLEARILAAADAFSAMTADPPFRRSRGTASALRELRANADTMFDPNVVNALCAVIEHGDDSPGPPTATATAS